jgi:hypothetical protein
MTLSSLSIYVVFADPHQGNDDVMPFSLSHPVLRTKPDIHYMCGYMVDIYMVANLILLCSLKTYLSLKLGINFARKYWLSYSSLFLGGHLSTHCFRYLGQLSIFSTFFYE